MVKIALFFGIGIFLRAFNIKKFHLAKVLNMAIIYVSLPALILYKIPTIKVSTDTLIVLVMPWNLAFILPFIVILFSKRFNLSKKETGSLLLVSVLGNTSFLGVPLIGMFYGEAYVPYALLYDQLGSFLILSTYGSVVTAIYSSNSNLHIKTIIKKIVLFPPFLALIIAFILQDSNMIQVFKWILKPLSSTLVPFALMSVGYQLKFKVPYDERKALIIAILIKTIISPVIALLISLAFFSFDTITKVAILEAGMGPMITAGIMANLVGLKPRLTNAIVGYGILFSFATLPIFYKILSYF